MYYTIVDEDAAKEFHRWLERKLKDLSGGQRQRVSIGDNVLFGPNVQLYTATHPLDAESRRSGLEAGHPIDIGDDCWIGGGAIINPGVSIGPRSVIGPAVS
ncbi:MULTISPECIES: DapH/DapD/GlmU-related protein [Halomonas]|uniref:Succinyltransferase-like protein n=1 Tax=Halomonas ventosae TaxID=229007 RepID=A0A4R6HQC0_9GAMM|nr:DapH/DapD/GlmU-related protein [Halomonas ventosae]TDO10558.1 succinyltransferase-like protein [Halomonas ventosae]